MGKLYGAIYASPVVVLAKQGHLEAGPITSYHAFADKFPEKVDYNKDQLVVVTGTCITIQEPAAAMKMGVKIVELLYGKEKDIKVVKGFLLYIVFLSMYHLHELVIK